MVELEEKEEGRQDDAVFSVLCDDVLGSDGLVSSKEDNHSLTLCTCDMDHTPLVLILWMTMIVILI